MRHGRREQRDTGPRGPQGQGLHLRGMRRSSASRKCDPDDHLDRATCAFDRLVLVACRLLALPVMLPIVFTTTSLPLTACFFDGGPASFLERYISASAWALDPTFMKSGITTGTRYCTHSSTVLYSFGNAQIFVFVQRLSILCQPC
jgi:hypothetical protein